jgi:hypothetical protein
MRRPSRWCSALLGLALVSGCGSTDRSISVSASLGNVSGSRTAAPEGEPTATAPEGDDASTWSASPVVFRACPRTLADPGATHLRPPSRVTAATAAQVPHGLPLGVVRLEHAADLMLGQGTIAAGNGYDAATGPTLETVRVSPGAVIAPVTIAVYDSPQTGRRVLFVEVRVAPGTPVSWVEERKLGILTDGGDGGFVDGSASGPDGAPQDGGPGDYVEAFYPGGSSGSGNVCVQRIDVAGRVDAVLFSTGFGDGGYPTFLGRDADGRVVSVVHDSMIVPWSFSGLPGAPPAGAQLS